MGPIGTISVLDRTHFNGSSVKRYNLTLKLFDKDTIKKVLSGTVSADRTQFYGSFVKHRYGTLKEDYGV